MGSSLFGIYCHFIFTSPADLEVFGRYVFDYFMHKQYCLAGCLLLSGGLIKYLYKRKKAGKIKEEEKNKDELVKFFSDNNNMGVFCLQIVKSIPIHSLMRHLFTFTVQLLLLQVHLL